MCGCRLEKLSRDHYFFRSCGHSWQWRFVDSLPLKGRLWLNNSETCNQTTQAWKQTHKLMIIWKLKVLKTCLQDSVTWIFWKQKNILYKRTATDLCFLLFEKHTKKSLRDLLPLTFLFFLQHLAWKTGGDRQLHKNQWWSQSEVENSVQKNQREKGRQVWLAGYVPKIRHFWICKSSQNRTANGP